MVNYRITLLNKFLPLQVANIACYHLGGKPVALCLYSARSNAL